MRGNTPFTHSTLVISMTETYVRSSIRDLPFINYYVVSIAVIIIIIITCNVNHACMHAARRHTVDIQTRMV